MPTSSTPRLVSYSCGATSSPSAPRTNGAGAPVSFPSEAIRYAASGVLRPGGAPPPYDVIEPEERAALLARDPHNSVRLDPPRHATTARPRRSARGRTTACSSPTTTPSFSVYRMTFTDETGRTRHDHRRDRRARARGPRHGDPAPRAHAARRRRPTGWSCCARRAPTLDPIWGLSARGRPRRLLDTDGDPLATARDDDGVRPRAVPRSTTRIGSPRSARAVAGAALVLADGHHRFETACTYRAERDADDVRGAGAAIMALVVELAPRRSSGCSRSTA